MDFPDILQSPGPVGLEHIMLRSDVWRGEGHQTAQAAVISSGYGALDAALLNGGWPHGLIEIGQQGFTQQEWLLLAPALNTVEGLIVLINPPYQPFVQGLLAMGIDLDRLRIVRTDTKADFLASFVEITRTSACAALLAWEPKHALSYTELRKCLLSSNEGQGLYTLFRPAATQQQSSPASLRLTVAMQSQHLHICIYKQRGTLQSDRLVKVDLPEDLSMALPYHLLDSYDFDGVVLRPKPKAPVIPVKWGHRS